MRHLANIAPRSRRARMLSLDVDWRGKRRLMHDWHRSEGAASRQPMPIADLLVRAEQQRVAGHLAEAAATCRSILDAQPGEPNATHLLGLIAHQSGKLGEAIEHLRRAVNLAPDVPLYHANLGEMCRIAG